MLFPAASSYIASYTYGVQQASLSTPSTRTARPQSSPTCSKRVLQWLCVISLVRLSSSMLPALTRRSLLARVFTAALTSAVRVPSSYRSTALTSSSTLTSLLRSSILSTSRSVADVARSPATAATSDDFPTHPAAPSTTAAHDTSSTAPSHSKAVNSLAPAAASRKRGRSLLTPEQQKAAERRAKQLLRAKQQERARKERERAVSTRLKKQHRRIVTQERARERATLTKQRRQQLKDQLRTKAAREKQLRAEERAVAQQYQALQSTRPKRPLSPFIAYAQSVRSSLPASEVSNRPTETTRLLASRWRGLSGDEKRKWEAQYRAAIPAYEQKMQQWNEEQRTHRPPIRPLNAYARYAQKRIKEIRAAEGGGARAPELMKRVAAEWRNVSADEKERLKREVVSDMTGYTERLKQWEKRPADELALWRLQRATQKKKRERRKAKIALNKQATGKVTATTAQ